VKEIFLAWQDSREDSRRWYPVGRLVFDGTHYTFSYTKGAEDARNAGFEPIQPFSDIFGIYQNKSLFPVFANRVLSPARKDFMQYVAWLNLPPDRQEPLVILGRSGGTKPTDTFQIFACPERDERGRYTLSFFVHGIRHIQGAIDAVNELNAGQELELVPEPDNKHDQWAVKVANRDQVIGYCPRFINHDLHRLMSGDSGKVMARIERINDESAPIQYKVLCTVQADWPHGFEPFSDPEYKSIGTHQVEVSTIDTNTARFA
jgi:hypothetical protein